MCLYANVAKTRSCRRTPFVCSWSYNIVLSEASEKSGRSLRPGRPADGDEIAILLKPREAFAGLTATQISRFLAKKRSKPRKEIQKKATAFSKRKDLSGQGP